MLEELDLGSNMLKRLPSGIAKLTNLRVLNLESNEISEIPPEIGELKNLTHLCLSENQLNHLPSEIGKLKRLETLDLSGNRLKTLPSEICDLKNLRELVLYGNRELSTLPDEIDHLKNLESLCLERTDIEFSKIRRFDFDDKTKIAVSDKPEKPRYYLKDTSLLGSFGKYVSGKHIIKKISKNRLEVLDLMDGKKLNSFEIFPNGREFEYHRMEDCSVSPDEKHLVATEVDCEEYGGIGYLHVWEIKSGRSKDFERTLMNGISDIAFTDDGKYLKVKHFGPKDIVWDFHNGKIVSK